MTFKILQGDVALSSSVEGRINLIYANSGSGKTRLALTATKNKKVLFCDIENAIGKVWANVPDEQKNKDNLFTWNPKSIPELMSFIDSPQSEEYDLIVVDTLTFLADSDLARFTDLGKTLSFTHYGDLGRNISAVIRRAQLRGINIDFLMQAEQIDAVDGSQKFFPRSPGKTIVPVVKERADNIIFLTVEGGKHVAYTVPGKGHHAKSRDPLPDRIETEDLNYQFLESCFVSYEIPAASADDLLELDEAITRLSEMKVSMELDPVDTAALRAFVGVVDGGKFNHRQCFNAYEAIVAQIKSTALEIEASELTSQITNNVETLTSMTPVNRATK